ncbi:hypothetical protein GYA93_15095 [Gordonia desulfuricans]|uniref:Uncharacterized protein n=1 Tax=Gordonia desulfuricans TaxID=89051 RepID=A0A7K3LRP6_9ACTN|nr:hypothetical protein [Gordonia desulfuricans]NDK90898.1 hypothetical protein [Gordonia desulfuricans]
MGDVDATVGEAVHDLVEVVGVDQRHRHDHRTVPLGDGVGEGRDHRRPPLRPVLEVAARVGGQHLVDAVSDQLGIGDCAFPQRRASSNAVWVLPAPKAPLIQTSMAPSVGTGP